MAIKMMTAARISPLLALIVVAAACGGTATETVCTNGKDDDGDGNPDCLDDDCADFMACMEPVSEVCTGGLDEDQDQMVDCEDDDCWDDPGCYQFDDDTDLPGPNGDPSVDIDKFRVTLVNNVATFYATFDGDWPPPSTTYSYFVLFEIDNDGNTPQASVTFEFHDGVADRILLGIQDVNVLTLEGPRGVYVRMTGVPAAGEKFYVESGIQKTNPGTRVTDTVVGAPAPLP